MPRRILIWKAMVCSLALAAVCRAELVFSGYVYWPDEARFVLGDSENRYPSRWLAIGDSYLGYRIVEHDQQREVLVVERDGVRTEVPLKIARILPMPPGKHRIESVKFQFAGESGISEEAVREVMQIRGGAEIGPEELDKDLRSIFRTGRFRSIEFKLERIDANAVNLLVLLTPKIQGEPGATDNPDSGGK